MAEDKLDSGWAGGLVPVSSHHTTDLTDLTDEARASQRIQPSLVRCTLPRRDLYKSDLYARQRRW